MNDTEMESIFRKIEHVNNRVTKISERVSMILANQKHYLNNRGKNVLKRQGAALKAISNLNYKIKQIPKLSVAFSKKSKGGTQRVILMVSHNQARKLRALADLDLRPILNAKANASKSKRLSLAEPGTKAYRNT